MDTSGRIYEVKDEAEMKKAVEKGHAEITPERAKLIEGMNRRQRRDFARKNGWFKKAGVR